MPEPFVFDPFWAPPAPIGLLSVRYAPVQEPTYVEGVSLTPLVAPDRLPEPKDNLVPVAIELRFDVEWLY